MTVLPVSNDVTVLQNCWIKEDVQDYLENKMESNKIDGREMKEIKIRKLQLEDWLSRYDCRDSSLASLAALSVCLHTQNSILHENELISLWIMFNDIEFFRT